MPADLPTPDSPLALPPQAALELRAALQAAGCRFTGQRAAVYAYLQGVEDHPTAEQVYQAVREQLPNISLATVYKSLEALAQSGVAHKLTYGDGSARYDCRAEEHYHLRDVATGEVRDLPARYDPKLLEKLDPQLSNQLARDGFKITGSRLEVLGRFEAKKQRPEVLNIERDR